MSNDIQFLKTKAAKIRNTYIEDMERHLLAFESKLSTRNIKVRWLNDEQEMVDFICKSMPKNNYNKVCFDIPYISDEFFTKKNFIKSVSISDLEQNNDTAETLVVQGDFGVVENGSVVLINKQSKNCFNNVEKLFIILNIKDLIVRQNDLEVILYLKTGLDNLLQFEDIKIVTMPFTRIISKKILVSDEDSYTKDKVEVFVLLYNNDIIEILENNVLRETLYCINCGKCKEVCPVFQQTQEFSPIDLIKYHSKEENKRAVKLFENTTLCGNCNEVCPVQINFTQLIINQMQYFSRRSNFREKNLDLFKVFSKRTKMNKVNSKFRRYFFVKKYFGKNKRLSNYFSLYKEPFFNIQHKETQQQ